MLTVNFDLNALGHFHDDTNDPKTEIISAGGKDVTYTFHNPLMKTNIYRLLEHPAFRDVVKAKFEFTQIFKNVQSDESYRTLLLFGQNLYNVCADIIVTAHLLYWQDAALPATHADYAAHPINIRSPFSFDEILKECIELGMLRLKILNKIVDMKNSSTIQSIIINSQLKKNIKNNVKKLGYKSNYIMDKSK